MSEFEGIFDLSAGRPLTSYPHKAMASRDFIYEVKDMLSAANGDEAEVADWIADKMDRFAASSARPVFDMGGNGPQCSYCMAIWPLCGHDRLSEVEFDSGDSDD